MAGSEYLSLRGRRLATFAIRIKTEPNYRTHVSLPCPRRKSSQDQALACPNTVHLRMASDPVQVAVQGPLFARSVRAVFVSYLDLPNDSLSRPQLPETTRVGTEVV
jgi:hypothetical protein